MLKILEESTLGHADYGWLKPRYHFSFANYYDKDKLGIGPLRVLNDDIVFPNKGFDPHPHHDMEIITYVIHGELTHTDSMGNTRKVKRGGVQYMSAGTGVVHSEYNNGSEILRLLQIWFYPNQKNLEPNYGDCEFDQTQRENQFLHIASSKSGDGYIKMNQEVNIFVIELDKDNIKSFDIDAKQSLYLVQMEGSSYINQQLVEEGDALYATENVEIQALDNCHILLIQM
ncbi:MAG: pirin family protein [Bacilli bacterium]|nr:pirin family protein [Bacilli bacterium]